MTPLVVAKSVWRWLDGKKTAIGMVLIFVSGGLEAIGAPAETLEVLALVIGALGLGHKAVKRG